MLRVVIHYIVGKIEEDVSPGHVRSGAGRKMPTPELK